MNKNINWDEVEEKIAIICYKFDNLAPWRDELAQELRIHAYYVSDNYYDLHRKAIDFWRKIRTRLNVEAPYVDLELTGNAYSEEKPLDQFDDIINLIRKELNRPPQNKWDDNKMKLAMKLLDIILGDINPEKQEEKLSLNKSNLSHYVNQRLNLSWVSEETGVGYKQLIVAMKVLEDIVRGLHAMHKIEIPLEYFKGYYEE